MKANALSLQSSVVGRANLRTYIQAAQMAGFDAIEPTKVQLDYFFNAGHTPQDVKALLGDIKISSVGWLSDIERQGHDFVVMMKEAEKLFEMSAAIGGQAVEILNGPVDWRAVESFRHNLPYQGYMGLQGLPLPEQQRLTVKNMQALADLAKDFGLSLFFEPLCWTSFPSLKEGIPLIEQAERDNLKVVVDFYHNYIAGLDAEFLAKMDKRHILGVHICNSRQRSEQIPCEEIFRDAGFYDGVIPIKEWVDAVKSTGFDGWWAYETFSKREAEEEIYRFSRYVHQELHKLVHGGGQ
ncbi:sugar phosphate isomerase/epimerase family protein [Testudinibacter aquarius]|uniref:Sugar phosphate isomerase/epimerase n=1 Tax=Testudinibacter aquarius TaxID=1524974 RepID=A0A4R3YA24_9PAST|nr:sugar phosphate isomerase/epimerase family protein [Testudinibacter aquarius]KAE9528961.1 hypothetical protein A1D24_08795 [Testudinibacter aquarius]TCV89235.1 sugar phosphate isomerase/epimerase [Testudinibacter aquarius]TNG93299.1 sugar phosphate isomerase/epimerase [Testudinibacter aquarius]